MDKKQNELVVDTRGYCFLCLNQINLIAEPDDNKENFVCAHSIQYLSKYLKLDRGKVFQGPVPLNLLEKVERSKLKVELCSECSNLNAKLSELFSHLERIEMEIIFRLGILSGKINCSEETGKIELIKNKLKNSNLDLYGVDLMGKLEIAQVLREETNRKCSIRLNNFNSIPNIKIEKTEWKKSEKIEMDIDATEEIKKEFFSYPTDGPNDIDDDFQQEFEDDHLDQPPSSSSASKSQETAPIKTETVSWRQRKWKTTSSELKNKMKGEKFSISEDKNLTIVPPPNKSGPNGTASRGYFISKRIINPDNGRHKCRICSKEYLQYRNFRAHFKSAHMKVSYTCPVPVCAESFRRKENYEKHYKRIHLSIRQQCQICEKTFSDKSYLNMHVRTVHK